MSPLQLYPVLMARRARPTHFLSAYSTSITKTHLKIKHNSHFSRMMNTTGPRNTPILPNFPVTPPDPNLSQRNPARRAACVIIGDEILNGKTLDTNSHHLAGLLFRSGITLAKVEIVPDEETEIVECVRRLAEPEARFDLIFTSGGIGPTHGQPTSFFHTSNPLLLILLVTRLLSISTIRFE